MSDPSSSLSALPEPSPSASEPAAQDPSEAALSDPDQAPASAIVPTTAAAPRRSFRSVLRSVGSAIGSAAAATWEVLRAEKRAIAILGSTALAPGLLVLVYDCITRREMFTARA